MKNAKLKLQAELGEIVPDTAVLDENGRFTIVALTMTQAQRLGEQACTIDDIRLLVVGPERVTSRSDLAALCAAATETDD